MIPHREAAQFDAFVAGASSRLLRTAYLLCGDRGHAEDLVQTALLRTARRWRAARDQPEAYTRRVVVNLAKDRHRARSRRLAEVPMDASPDPVTPGREGEVLDRDALLGVVRGLPDGQRAVLVLRYFDDLSVEETADALGVTTGTVKSQTSRALASLRLTLDPTAPGDPR
ncbi:SigE family RNA polymerase sigma factor [Nocardioides plantarum]|uniref:SigE family RNA polymerase sigma factor n=1 Tax=Nocardioides plantarum TaxID=29299 RepID=A0ABV5KG30_9ACTN|nr:SigE family RNA polymerase sigma factor [Nocardioides plantarum]